MYELEDEDIDAGERTTFLLHLSKSLKKDLQHFALKKDETASSLVRKLVRKVIADDESSR